MKNTSPWYNKVKEFMEAGGQTVPDSPDQLSMEDANLRARLILEEAIETCIALGVTPRVNGEVLRMDSIQFESEYPQHIIGTIDGCCDLMYVTLGTLVSMGLPDDPFMTEVCDNNLTKVKPTVRIVNGKIQKPPGYQPPDLGKVLDNILDETR